MSIIQRIALKKMRFFACHGYYPEERKVGNEFLLDIEVTMRVQENLNDELSNTINYEDLFKIAAVEMQAPRKLLETVVQRILKKITSNWPDIETALVSLRKLNLPMGCEMESSLVEVIYTKQL